MRVLLLSKDYTGYVIQLWKAIKQHSPDISLSLLSEKQAALKYEQSLPLEEDERIYYYPSHLNWSFFLCYKAIKNLPRFDIIHALWMEYDWGIFACQLQKKTNGIYISVGGSDLYRKSKKKWIKYLQSRLIKKTSIISSENSATRDYFYAVYGDWTREIPHRIVRFGVDVIDEIKKLSNFDKISIKQRYGIPLDKIIVMLGHNGSFSHQHLSMVSSIERLDTKLIDKCFFLIPMTYGVPSSDYRKKVEKRLSMVTDQYLFLDEYLDVKRMAEMTISTDIMIHMQTTDQLSSTMMSHLYNGNIVLAGSWLPYSDIKEKGIKIFDVDDFHSLTSALSDVLRCIEVYKEKCKDNKDKVYEFSSWDSCINDWVSVYAYMVNTVS